MTLHWPGVQPDDMPSLHPRTMRKRMKEYWRQQHREYQERVLAEIVLARADRIDRVGDVPSLAADLGDPLAASLTLGHGKPVEWRHEVWAVNPVTGGWYRHTHNWMATPKARSAMRGPQQCLVCSGDFIDSSPSVSTFMPDLEREYADGRVGFADVPMGLHSAGSTKWSYLADGKGYVSLTWICRTHGEFVATMNNRTAEHGGTGCPKCGPRGISKEQIRLACYVKQFVTDCDLDPDPLAVPADVRSLLAWGSSVVKPDIVLPSQRIIIEYDGEFGHLARLRPEAAGNARRQTQVMLALGYDVLRVSVETSADAEREITLRVGDRSEMTIRVASPVDIRGAALESLHALEVLAGNCFGGLSADFDRLSAGAEAQAAAEIRRLWGASGRKRRQRNAKGRTSKFVHVEPGRRFGHLVVTTAPPKTTGSGRKPQGHLVPCHCDCGSDVDVPAIYLRKSHNPKRYCSRSCPLIPRPAVVSLAPGESALKIRLWARARGIEVGESGRIPARVLAEYRKATETRG